MIIIILIIGVYFLVFNLIFVKEKIEKRTEVITKPLTKFVKVSPLIGIALFTILFTTVLKGKILERSSHAIIVFVLWMYVTYFYCGLLAHYKNRMSLLFSSIGIVVSIVCAIILTPLERYNAIIYAHIGIGSYILGTVMILIFYISTTIKG